MDSLLFRRQVLFHSDLLGLLYPENMVVGREDPNSALLPMALGIPERGKSLEAGGIESG